MKRTTITLLFPVLVALVPAGGVAAVATVEEGCSTLPPTTPITGTLPALGICVVSAAINDIVQAIQDPVSLIGAIISACASYGTATADEIYNWIEQALASQPIFADSGLSVSDYKSRLSKVRSAALTMQHVTVTAVPAVPAAPAPAAH
jgi:hypothetical protein